MIENRFVNRLKVLRILAVVVPVLAMSACVSVPLDYPRTPSTALTDTADTPLAAASTRWRKGHTQSNGFYSLSQGKDAFGARLTLMDKAEKSIDAQYFLMKPDNAGLVFTKTLMAAADRGVRVRLLLDDIFTTVDDEYFSYMNSHPNVEIRIFNPISRKGVFAFNYVGNFSLANRRMHNKSFIADNQVAIVGGRNIAAEYFQLETSGEFIDFDMLATGPIVQKISTQFDTYWNSELAIPMQALADPLSKEKTEQNAMAVTQLMDEAGNSVYAKAIHSELLQKFSEQTVSPYIAKSRIIVDDPKKLRSEISKKNQILATEVAKLLQNAKQEIVLITPYFIPGKKGIEFIRKIRDKGVRIILVTNSLASNNHTPVHSAYSSYRKELLDMGVELWEARANAAQITVDSDDTTLTEPLTLHTKGILIDRNKVFVGSLNLDPRSIDINTEMGVLIESEPLTSRLRDETMKIVPNIAYRLKMDENRKISWHANIDGKEVVETKEPLTTAWRRFTAWFLKIVPEGQL